MAFDFKKEYKEFYLPSKKPQIVTVGPMSFIAVRGEGDPSVEDGAYKQAVGMLYAVAYTVKMSKKGDHRIEGYFDFVVPPLEGFWQQPGVEGFDCARKQDFQWISVIRMPDFVTDVDLDWAKGEVARKKGVDCSKVELVTIDEGECVQAMHVGPYDDEPATVALMDAYLAENGYENDFSDTRRHHEIYLSDPRRVAPEKCKTVIRHPVRRA
ncbi:GyrI-like domain-containing protein [Xiamenia xianingshaonis]|uniref:GyrI-like domain-containing protein n=1 Tax=Xiamenia xianingshaonis TaxID=2682776 RepID=A0A9E6STY4_9ACTN|nr:GyrI-like domain-containing protein [Xiamenia xianingshaonis]NHM14929.1 transcriptional regulator [Xiamenia xianingshaonis]QTU83737.1 GyrI-like domain-containing protein [Xiamenia xianingshaonis]